MEEKERESLFNEVNEALLEISLRHNLVYEESKLKEKDGKIELKTSFSTLVNGLNRFQIEYLKYADVLDLKKDWLNFSINHKLNGYKIMGLNIKKYKNPVIVYNLSKHEKVFMHPDKVREIWNNGIKINHRS